MTKANSNSQTCVDWAERDARVAGKIAADEQRKRDRELESRILRCNLPTLHHAKARQCDYGCIAWGETADKLECQLGTGLLAILGGKRGVGKTQMGVELLLQGCKKGLCGNYIKAMDFFLDVRATYGGKTDLQERDVIQEYLRAQVLVIDAMQNRGESEWENRLLIHLIDHRYDAQKDTILISNQTKQAFADSLGPDIVSRAKQNGGFVECDWDSFRGA